MRSCDSSFVDDSSSNEEFDLMKEEDIAMLVALHDLVCETYRMRGPSEARCLVLHVGQDLSIGLFLSPSIHVQPGVVAGLTS